MNKTLAVLVHARRESTRVPDKHLRPLDTAGNCMLDTTLRKVSDIKNVNEKYLAAWDPEIIDRYVPGVNILHRERASVAPGNCHHSIMYKHLEEVESDYICNYNPCQPFLDLNKIQEVIDWFIGSKYESAITVKKTRNFFWHDNLKPVNFKSKDRLSTTSGPWLYEATHSLVFYKKDYMLNNWELFSNSENDPHPYVVDWSEEELVDVDTETDFKLVQKLYEIRNRH